jgi:hypothetical protein
VNSFAKKIPWATVFRRLAEVSTLLYVFSRFIPATPVAQYPINGDIDHAWTQVLHAAYLHGWQFGRDLVFTYGPWGFLSRGYQPETYPAAVAAWLLLSLVFWQAGWRLACQLSGQRLFSWLWMIAFTGMASLPVGNDIDVRLVAWAVLLLFLHFFAEPGPSTPTQALLVVSLGWLSLVKFTGLVESALVVSLMAADDLLRRRRFPWMVPLWLASLLFFWIVAGQKLGSLGPYLYYSWQLAGGYTEAMSVTPEGEAWKVGRFLLLALWLGLLAGWVAWRRHRFWGMLPLAGLAGLLFIIFKEGFVRPDWHEITAAMALLVVAGAALAVFWPVDRRSAWLALLLFVGTELTASSVLRNLLYGEGLAARLGETFSYRSLTAPIDAVLTGSLREEYENEIRHRRRACFLPPISGDADLYSYYQTVLFICDLPYQPRPVIQSYTAYTPELAGLNADHLRTKRAARNLLFSLQPIDGRFPALDDALSWPVMLTRYDLKASAEAFGRSYLVLTRSAAPREYHLTPVGEVSARWGEPVAPPAAAGPIWVEIGIRKTLIGSLVATLYKPPLLKLTVTLRDRERPDYRLVPALAGSGFLLSPVITNTWAFAELAGTNWQASLAGREVMSMTVSADTRSGSTRCYRAPLAIRFYRLEFPPQEFKVIQPGGPAGG